MLLTGICGTTAGATAMWVDGGVSCAVKNIWMKWKQEDITINTNKNAIIVITVIFAESDFTETDPTQNIENITIVNIG